MLSISLGLIMSPGMLFTRDTLQQNSCWGGYAEHSGWDRAVLKSLRALLGIK
jgi:hypothetical protein